jgi:C-terminal processing protease CtpA/Prc
LRYRAITFYQFAHSFIVLCLLVMGGAYFKITAQSLKIDRYRGQEMLKTIQADLEKHYYDPSFRGMDVAARFRRADERIKGANSNAEILGIIAQVLLELDDSHTYFMPPDRVARFDYGWRVQMIGEQCYVTEVSPGSDAAKQGLKVGSLLETVGGISVDRTNLWKFEYLYHRLKPKTGVKLEVREPNGATRELNVTTTLIEGENRYREREAALKREEEQRKAGTSPKYPRYHQLGANFIICKLPRFNLTNKQVDEMMKRIIPHQGLILDLRGNGGGREETLLRLLGYFFERNVKVADLKWRGKSKPLIAEPHGKSIFTGQLIVLVDSRSASAAELFARVMQLEKRGAVIGDATRGAVMRAQLLGHSCSRGPDAYQSISYYGVAITIADSVMTDGKSLEKIGVKPDEVVLPSGADLAARRDPTLARAAALLGVMLDAKQAGTIFPSAPNNEPLAEEDATERD